MSDLRYADKAPSEKRRARYAELAKLKLDAKTSFGTRTEAQWEGWEACWNAMHVEEMFGLLQRYAILDETLRWPVLDRPSIHEVESKFEAMMRAVQKVVWEIQDAHAKTDEVIQ